MISFWFSLLWHAAAWSWRELRAIQAERNQRASRPKAKGPL